jgi:DNA-binding transcriptional regulator YiaG
MTPQEFKACREAVGLTQAEWASAMGYANKNLRQQAWDMENGRKAITTHAARLAEMYRRYGVPKDFAVREDE